MGRKTLYFAVGTGGFAALFRLIALFLPLDKVSIDTVLSQEILSLETKCLTVEVDVGRGFCSYVDSEYCSQPERSLFLTEASRQFCSTVYEGVLPDACLGLKRARTCGMILVAVVVVAYVLQATSGWFMRRYIAVQAKKQYRENTLMMTGSIVVMMFLMLMIYWILALRALNEVKPQGSLSAFVQQNKGSTVAIGYLLLWLSVVLDVASAVFLNFAKSNDEDEMLQAELELGHTWAAGQPGFEGGQPGYVGGWGQPTPAYETPGWGQPGMQQEGMPPPPQY